MGERAGPLEHAGLSGPDGDPGRRPGRVRFVAHVGWADSLDAAAAHAFFEQSYDVLPGKVAEFEAWFRSEGGKRFLAVDGLVGIDTFVDVTRTEQVVTSVFGFRDDASLLAFANTEDPAITAVGREFDAFVGAHDHTLFHTAPMYRAPGLSVP